MSKLTSLNVKIFADGAAVDSIEEYAKESFIAGFTTNPTLMKQAGVSSYRDFADTVLPLIGNKPISFEVIADDQKEMEDQARTISSWSENIYVKVPITNTKGEFTAAAIQNLSSDGIKLNVTALTTLEQVRAATECLSASTPGIVSVMAGRISDTGCDAVAMMKESVAILKQKPSLELLWASTRELYNLIQADQIGCQIATMTPALLKKLKLLDKDLHEYSRETVEMFYQDALEAKLSIK